MKNQESVSTNNTEMPVKLGELEQNKVILTMPSTAQLGQLSGLKTVYKMNPAYRTQEEWLLLKDKPVRAYFLGLKDLPNENGEAVTCAIFADAEQMFLCAQFMLVEAVRHEAPQTAFEITYRGKKRNKVASDRYTNLFDITKLGV